MIAAAWAAFRGSKVFGYLIVAVAAIGAVVLVLARAFGAGKAAERADQAERLDTLRRQADEVRNDVDAADDADVDRLRDKWTR